MPARKPSRLSKKKRSPYWQAEFYDSVGRRHRVSTQCTDRQAALDALRRFEKEAQDPAHQAAHKAGTLKDALDTFVARCGQSVASRTVDFYEQKAAHLDRLLGHKDLALLAVDDVQAYIDRRLKEGSHRRSVEKELSCLRQALKMAHSRGLLRVDPRSLVPAFKARYLPRQAYLTRTQYAALRLATVAHRRLWCDVAVYTGARKSEVERIVWEGVDFDKDTILIPGEKTEASYAVIPLHPELRKRLLEVSAEKRRGLIVGKWAGAYQGMAVACRKAGIVLREPSGAVHLRITPHFLRRTLAVWLKQDGADSWVVAAILRHKSTAMLEKVYAQPSLANVEQMRAAMSKKKAPAGKGKSAEAR